MFYKITCYSIYITINYVIKISDIHYSTITIVCIIINKNTIKEKVIYMQAVAQQKYICGLKHIANLYNITIVR